MKNRLFVLVLCLFCGAQTLLAQTEGLAILNSDTVSICRGDTLLLEVDNQTGEELTWLTVAGFLDDDTAATARVIPDFSRYYVVAAGDFLDSIYVDVDVFVVPTLINDTLLCQGYPLQLVQTALTNTGNTNYNWSPGTFLEDSTDVNAIYDPNLFRDTVFTLISTAANEACADTQSVRVELIRSSLSIFNEDTVFRCLGEEATVLEVAADPRPGSSPVWFPTTGQVGTSDGFTLRVNPRSNVTYYVEDVLNGCYQIDSVYVRTDSLPLDMTLTADPVKDPYCQGDTFFLQSPIFDPGDYPLITHEWTVSPGLASPQDLYNGVFFAQDSALMTRITENGACARTDTLQINVIKPPILIFDPLPAMVCPGEPLQINVSFDPSGPRGTLEWTDPMNTLSCDDCLNPVAIVNQATTYMIEVTSEGSDCTEPTEYSINIIEDLQPQLNPNTDLCPGDARRVITSNVVPGYTYRITGPGVDTNNPNVEVTPPADNTTYTVVTTGECGTYTDEVTFNWIEYTVTINGPESVCPDESAVLTAQRSGGVNGTFVWTLPDGTQAPPQPTPNQLELRDLTPGVYTYMVTFTDNFGCGSETASFTFTVVDANFAGLNIIGVNSSGELVNNGSPIFPGTQVNLQVEGVPAGLDVTYNWVGNYDPATATSAGVTVTAPRAEGSPNLSYRVTVTTVDGGCSATADFTLNFRGNDIEIPEVITPNGDGRNDIFRIFLGGGSTTGDVSDYSLTIFNRWGQKVFTFTDFSEAWDGNKDGTPQNSDTYLYYATFRLNGVEETRDGQFTLVR